MTGRSISHRYQDPLDLVWLRAAERLGLKVERSNEVYAAWDGQRTLTLASADDFDPDDSLAQLVFHEICHALVAGPQGRRQPDWGLDNTSERDLVQEHACHRVQAALAGRYGLRDFFAVTTEWRPYWDALPRDPLASSDDPALPLARRAHAAASESPWREALEEALDATARLATIARSVASEGSLWRKTRALHVTGFLTHECAELRCADCAWSRRNLNGLACRQSERVGRKLVLPRQAAACELWEPRLSEASCETCGACCREGFDRVEVRPRDRVCKAHPELVHEDHFGVFVPRPDGRCLALTGDGNAAAFRCRVYDDRPRSCAEFAIGGDACLVARRRVGLSP